MCISSADWIVHHAVPEGRRAYSRTITMEASGVELVKVDESFSKLDEKQSCFPARMGDE
jgi:hypothetical protein